jgi:hypothetical protein
MFARLVAFAWMQWRRIQYIYIYNTTVESGSAHQARGGECQRYESRDGIGIKKTKAKQGQVGNQHCYPDRSLRHNHGQLCYGYRYNLLLLTAQ